MLLAIDIGNSNISVGLFDEKRDLKFLSSIDTVEKRMAQDSVFRAEIEEMSKEIRGL